MLTYENYLLNFIDYKLIKHNDIEWQLLPPSGEEISSVRISFLTHQIAIHGGLCPKNRERGLFSAWNYGLEWFSSKYHGPHYLAEKFLHMEWNQETLKQDIMDFRINFQCGELMQQILDEAATCQSEEELYRLLKPHHLQVYLKSFGWRYNPCDLGRLISIHKKFAELYKEHHV